MEGKKLARLETFRVDPGPFRGTEVKELAGRSRQPAAIVIDLDRSPARGRDVGLALRMRKGTRGIPLVFAGGEDARVAEAKALLPDATYTTWSRAGAAVTRAIARPPATPVVPRSLFARYEGRPLAAKLGIRPGRTVAFLGAPPGFSPALPEGARVVPRGSADVLLWFTGGPVERDIARMAERARMLWVIWRKGGALTQAAVRRAGLARGLVDFKVVSVDETWTGLCFVRRR